MPKLIVNPRTDQSWEIPLPAGTIVLGSDPALEHAIAHETVSPAHCEVHVVGGTVAIKDLGSACGTFVDHAPVTEASIAPGQSLQLGEVELALASDAPATNSPPLPPRLPVAASVTGAEPGRTAACKYHPKALATWHCVECRAFFCDLCVNVRRMGESARHLCRKCGNDCAPVEVHYEPPVEENFYKLLPGVFAYPFSGNGAVLLAAGTVVFLMLGNLSRLGRFVPIYGLIVGGGIAVFVAGYVFSYCKSIVQSSAQGQDVPPDWPDFSDWTTEILQPCGQMFALLVLTFGPAMVLAFMRFQYSLSRYGAAGTAPAWFDEYGDMLAYASMAAGALFAPMGMLMLAMFDSVAALNPIPIILSILRIPLPYLVAAGTFELVLAAYVTVDHLAHLMGVPSLLTSLVMGFMELYALSVGMRILGLLYRTHKERLGWF
jgi:hypothetical protein